MKKQYLVIRAIIAMLLASSMAKGGGLEARLPLARVATST